MSPHPAAAVSGLTIVLLTAFVGAGTAQENLSYERRCAICHDSLEELARHSLVVIDGTLCGRYSRVDVEKLLTGHARLNAEEAKYFAEQLRRTARSLEEDRTSRNEACTDDIAR